MHPKALSRCLVLACALALVACEDMFTMRHRAEFNVRGIVRGIAADRRTISIQHEKIPGYLPDATTIFTVRKRRDVADLRPGYGVAFRVVVTEKEASVDRFNLISPEQVWVRPSPPPTTAQSSGLATPAQP